MALVPEGHGSTKKEVKIVENDGYLPICPHCENSLKEIHYLAKGFDLTGKTTIFTCSHCHKILSIGHNAGT